MISKVVSDSLGSLIVKRSTIDGYSITQNWLIGFVEAEGSFTGNEKQSATFQITQHAADWVLMEAIAKFIGCGTVKFIKRKDGRVFANYIVSDKKLLLEQIIPLFDNKFISSKKQDQFNNWKKIHFGLDSNNFNDQSVLSNNIHPDWLVGFVDGDGSFYPMIHKAKDYKCGYQIQATFDIAQIDSETGLLTKIGDQFFPNLYRWAKSSTTEHLRIVKLDTHISIVEPFFRDNILQSRKIYDFIIWRDILSLIKDKGHLTSSGVQTILALRDEQIRLRSYLSPSLIPKLKLLSMNTPQYKHIFFFL